VENEHVAAAHAHQRAGFVLAVLELPLLVVRQRDSEALGDSRTERMCSAEGKKTHRHLLNGRWPA
jgi:hypothetical protein